MAENEALTPEQQELLEQPNVAQLVTLMPDGSPQTSPVWIDYRDGMALVNTAEGRVKERNIRRDPRVALTIVDREDPYRYVSIRGRAVEVTPEGADDHIDELAKKYLGKDRYPWRNPEERRVLIKIRPERIAS